MIIAKMNWREKGFHFQQKLWSLIMSFNISAFGVAHGKPFHFNRDDCIDGDDFNIANLIATLQGLTPSSAGLVAAGIEHNLPGSGADAMGVIAQIEFLHVLKNCVDSLAMCDDAGNGWICVSSIEKRFILSDNFGFGKYEFDPGDDPGTEFMKIIGPGLANCGMDNWGVLRILVIVLTRYSDVLGQSGKPVLNIQLSK